MSRDILDSLRLFVAKATSIVISNKAVDCSISSINLIDNTIISCNLDHSYLLLNLANIIKMFLVECSLLFQVGMLFVKLKDQANPKVYIASMANCKEFLTLSRALI